MGLGRRKCDRNVYRAPTRDRLFLTNDWRWSLPMRWLQGARDTFSPLFFLYLVPKAVVVFVPIKYQINSCHHFAIPVSNMPPCLWDTIAPRRHQIFNFGLRWRGYHLSSLSRSSTGCFCLQMVSVVSVDVKHPVVKFWEVFYHDHATTITTTGTTVSQEPL